MLKYNVLMIMKKLDSSVKHWNDTILFSESQCLGTGMTPFIVSSHLPYDYLFRSPCLPILPLC
ncbi:MULTISPECIES: hypothetical protein [unclassified Wolbachia]|uniref:hypothetical protein n=1 Tax=unclassified Wolbachia TaxID=2640676 RepID=UPI003132F061